MQDEIALFIDFENIRYSLLNVQRREPDPQELISIAGRFGTVMVARAYADWGRQPDFFKGSLTAAMIDRVDCPAKVRERFRQNQNQSQQYYAAGQGQFDRRWRDNGENNHEYGYDESREEPLDEQDLLEGDEGADGDETGAEMREDTSGYERAADEMNDDAADDRRRPTEESYNGYQGQTYYPPQQQPSTIITQSTVDLNMLMDIIETVFDRPNINTYVLMSGDRDFTRICARLKHRLNKRVIVCGVPGTVSRDLISAAEQFIQLGYTGPQVAYNSGSLNSGPLAPNPMAPSAPGYQRPYTPGAQYTNTLAPVEPDEPGFIQFLDYIDRHWSWRTVGGVANFIGDPYNPKNRFRGRLTRDTARELLVACLEQGILDDAPDGQGSHNLRLNREHPRVAEVLSDLAQRQQATYQPYQPYQPTQQ
ncbi:MAG TPA: NYN domain-containing protein [Ktedonobacterales bacterium]|nr:NYN domain-containing protein [Ktedonobacterales bacterium]